MKRELGLYLHIPFCVRKCAYCDFNSCAAEGQDMDGYTACLVKEIIQAGQAAEDAYLDSIFLGGGTPSVLSNKNLERITDAVRRSFLISGDVEFTMECNPGTVSFRDMKAYREFGINRLSMGVQSLSDETLKRIGRIHTVNDFFDAYAAAKAAGFTNLNFDLMFSLPFQSLKDWQYTLEKILLFEPSHLSAYALQLEEGTPLYEQRERLRFPSEEEDRAMYQAAKEMLKEAGYRHYEISNFAQPGWESRHNLKYWELKEYLGLGLGASSFYGGRRFENPASLQDYIQSVQDNPPFRERGTQEDKAALEGEFMFLGLRMLDGPDDTRFQALFQESFFTVYQRAIETHLENGLLERTHQGVRLTERGLDLANTVMCDFV